MVWANKEKYSGSWAMGLRHGVGTMSFSSQDSYSGQWANDLVCTPQLPCLSVCLSVCAVSI